MNLLEVLLTVFVFTLACFIFVTLLLPWVTLLSQKYDRWVWDVLNRRK